ncbi:MAG TPA: fatty acid desaturase [Candidatus Binatia bacterium]|nr:fatty acid desaturase [Candidatus Binatia bacterium]
MPSRPSEQGEDRNRPPSQDWTDEQYRAFGAELDALHAEVTASLGPGDVAYVERVRGISRLAEVLGRALIHASIDPVTWFAGVVALWSHHQLEAIEIGHSALHGAWDQMPGAEKFHSSRFRWDTPVAEAAWKKEHNVLHHQYTNIVGRDPDLTYGPLRVSEDTRWIRYHLVQLGQFFWTAPVFLWMIALHATGLTDLLHPSKDPTYAPVLPDRSPRAILDALSATVKKAVPYALREFVFWPALAGPFCWKVLGGNVLADVMRNVYSCATIYAGHFGDRLEYRAREFRPRGRGRWYRMQIEAAHDYAVPSAVSLLCGALDHQIEHHLFPKLPPNRLREIAPRIEAICRRYGVRYTRDTWGGNLSAALKRFARMSLPPRAALA